MTLEQSIQNITERQAQRRAIVQESMARRMPEFPLELIRETFNARLEFYRSPEIEFGREEVLPGEVRSCRTTQSSSHAAAAPCSRSA